MTMKTDIDTAIHRFFTGEATAAETGMLTRWLAEDTAHKEHFRQSYNIFVATQMALDDKTVNEIRHKAAQLAEHREVRRRKRLTFISFATGVAAALALGFFLSYEIFTKPVYDLIDSNVLVSEAMQGQQGCVTLSDGTKIHLNSGSRIEYPAVFIGDERNVTLHGEAMFDVEHDPEHPFIVETFAYDVKVLGTRFDVVADEKAGEFSAALLEGSVSILGKDRTQKALLQPNEKVWCENGSLVKGNIANPEEDYLWTDGVISVAGVPFDKLMENIERTYGVRIMIDRDTLPEVNFTYLKVRITDGIDHLFRSLQRESDFTYYYDYDTGTYHIQ